jgi:hypothetical protein
MHKLLEQADKWFEGFFQNICIEPNWCERCLQIQTPNIRRYVGERLQMWRDFNELLHTKFNLNNFAEIYRKRFKTLTSRQHSANFQRISSIFCRARRALKIAPICVDPPGKESSKTPIAQAFRSTTEPAACQQPWAAAPKICSWASWVEGLPKRDISSWQPSVIQMDDIKFEMNSVKSAQKIS